MMNATHSSRLLFRLQPSGLPLRGQATQKAAAVGHWEGRLAAPIGSSLAQGLTNAPCFSILIQEYFV
jgi:hypothetical protein